MTNHKEEYRRRLPHIQPENAVYFVTFNLKDAIPKHIAIELNNQYSDVKNDLLNNAVQNRIESVKYNDSIGEILDSGLYSNNYLKDEKVATIVSDSLHFMDGKKFKLICYCIMSNHVHVIVYKLQEPLNKIMHSIKSYTGNECNKVLQSNGEFWQREYFDRIIRDRNDLDNKIKYTLNNPVNGGIVGYWREYEFSYCREEFVDM